MARGIPIFVSFLVLLLLGIARASTGNEKGQSIAQMMNQEIILTDRGEQNQGEIEFGWQEPQQKTKGKSALKAGALSLIIPGAGAYYLGGKSRAAAFFGTEAVIWGGYFAFHTWGKWKEDDYKSFAAGHAGANVSGKDDKFFERMQFYVSRDWFNEIEGERFGGAYPYTDYYYWHWDSEQSRQTFRRIRNDSKAAFRNATFMIGVALLNRVVSCVDAIRMARKLRKAEDVELYGKWKLDYDAQPFGGNPSAAIRLTKTIN